MDGPTAAKVSTAFAAYAGSGSSLHGRKGRLNPDKTARLTPLAISRTAKIRVPEAETSCATSSDRRKPGFRWPGREHTWPAQSGVVAGIRGVVPEVDGQLQDVRGARAPPRPKTTSGRPLPLMASELRVYQAMRPTCRRWSTRRRRKPGTRRRHAERISRATRQDEAQLAKLGVKPFTRRTSSPSRSG